MYICNRCGHITDTPMEFIQLHPYGDGYAGEKLQSLDCPACGYEMDKAEKCTICGEVKSSEDTDFYDGVCESCLVEKAGDLETIIKCAKASPTTEKVEVDSFLVFMLHPETVNEILWDYFKKCISSKAWGLLLRSQYREKAIDWATADLSWFGEALSEVMKNEQNGA